MNLSFTYAFLAGILAALTPCVVVLLPVTLYRFVREVNQKIIRPYFFYVLGFLSTFIIIGLFLTELSSSLQLSNAFRLFFAVTLMIIGTMQLLGKINPLDLPPVKNTFLLGVIVALSTGLNPCTLPFLGLIASVSVIHNSVLYLLLFGIGLLVPATLFLLLGKSFLKPIISQGHLFEKMNTLFSFLLIIAGIYLGLNISHLQQGDVKYIFLLMLFLLYFMFKTFLIGKKWYELFAPQNFFLILATLFLLGAVTYHCYGIIEQSAAMCSVECVICRKCLTLFSISAFFALMGAFIMQKLDS